MKFHRHAALNDIVQRSLASADIPSTLEPSGLSRSDGKRPDGLTFVPWERGRPLLWDATVLDTMAQSYCSIAITGGGCVARQAESKKVTNRVNGGIRSVISFIYPFPRPIDQS
jgi:hypothetical protein